MTDETIDDGERGEARSPSSSGRSRPSSSCPTTRCRTICSPSCSSSPCADRAVVRRAGRAIPLASNGFELRPSRRRVPLPDRLRPDAVRRTIPPARPAGAAVRRRARNAGDRRLQATDLAGPGRRDPGVDPDGVLRTLQARGYIDEVGRDDGPGQAILFGTTSTFLEKLGIDSVDDLPPIAEFIPGPDVVEALEHGLRVTPEIDVTTTAHRTRRCDASIEPGAPALGAERPSGAQSCRRANGCRRCWPRSASAAGARART